MPETLFTKNDYIVFDFFFIIDKLLKKKKTEKEKCHCFQFIDYVTFVSAAYIDKTLIRNYLNLWQMGVKYSNGKDRKRSRQVNVTC